MFGLLKKQQRYFK